MEEKKGLEIPKMWNKVKCTSKKERKKVIALLFNSINPIFS